MKILVGTDAGSYTFDASAGTITLSGLPVVKLEDLLIITNIVSSIGIIYNFADEQLSAIPLGNNVFALAADTTQMTDTDPLQIWIQLTPAGTTTLTYDLDGNLSTIYNGLTTTTLGYTEGVLTSVIKILGA
jgi:hypothetical protein